MTCEVVGCPPGVDRASTLFNTSHDLLQNGSAFDLVGTFLRVFQLFPLKLEGDRNNHA